MPISNRTPRCKFWLLLLYGCQKWSLLQWFWAEWAIGPLGGSPRQGCLWCSQDMMKVPIYVVSTWTTQKSQKFCRLLATLSLHQHCSVRLKNAPCYSYDAFPISLIGWGADTPYTFLPHSAPAASRSRYWRRIAATAGSIGADVYSNELTIGRRDMASWIVYRPTCACTVLDTRCIVYWRYALFALWSSPRTISPSELQRTV